MTIRSKARLAAALGCFVSACSLGDPGGGKSQTPSTAATPTISIPIGASTICDTKLTGVDLDQILDVYEQGTWPSLQGQLKKISDALETACKAAPELTKATRISFSLLDDHAPQPTVVRVLYGKSPAPSIFGQRLLAGPLFTVYLYREDGTPIFSTYSASPTPSPIEAGASQVLSTAAAGLSKGGSTKAATASSAVSALAPGNDKLKDALSKTLGRVDQLDSVIDTLAKLLPGMEATIHRTLSPVSVHCVVTQAKPPDDLDWAQITVTDTASVQALLTSSSIKNRIAGRLMNQPEATALNNTLATTLSDNDDCKARKPECQAALTTAARAALSKPQADPATRDALTAVFATYSGSLSATPTVSVQTAYSYGPLTHWTFGLGAGVLTRVNWHHQAKTGSNNVVADDTPTGAMTSVNAYYNFKGFDETTPKPACRELPHAVVGFVLTPNPGLLVGGGISMPFLRSVSLNGGYVVMLAPVLRPGVNVGDTIDPKLGSATKRGALGAWIAELGYSF